MGTVPAKCPPNGKGEHGDMRANLLLAPGLQELDAAYMGEARFRWFLLTMCWMRNEARVRLIVIRVIVIRVIVIDTIKNQANIVVIKAYLVLNYFHLDFANNYHSAWATRFANCGPKERIRHQPQRRPRQAALYRAGNN